VAVQFHGHADSFKNMSTTKTGISWTDRTWNPTRGCSRISPGCLNCYAERQAHRFSGPGQPYEGLVQITNGRPQWTGEVRPAEKALLEPLSWRKPARVFVDSMSDLFHEALPDESIDWVFAVMALCPHLTFQILTKRADRMWRYCERAAGRIADAIMALRRARGDTGVVCPLPHIPPGAIWWPLSNVWLGVSVEDGIRKHRIDLLRDTPAMSRFLSIEPLLEDIGELDLRGIDWVIIGGESGPGARPFNLEWAREIIAQCKAAGVAVFVKQVGSMPFDGMYKRYADPFRPGSRFAEPSRNSIYLHDRKGADMSEWPKELRVRQFPGTAKAGELCAE
jgi:protein gp37